MVYATFQHSVELTLTSWFSYISLKLNFLEATVLHNYVATPNILIVFWKSMPFSLFPGILLTSTPVVNIQEHYNTFLGRKSMCCHEGEMIHDATATLWEMWCQKSVWLPLLRRKVTSYTIWTRTSILSTVSLNNGQKLSKVV